MEIPQTLWRFWRELSRRLCTGKRGDYAAFGIIGAFPIGLAYLIHASDQVSNVADGSILSKICPNVKLVYGYFSRPNWLMFPLALPAGLLLVRWMAKRLGVVRNPQGGPYPLVELLPERGGKLVDKRLLGIAQNGRVLAVAFVIATICMIVDLKEQEVIYWKIFTVKQLVAANFPEKIDWVYYCLSKQPSQAGYASPPENLVLILAAYACQYLLITLAFFVTLMIGVHNFVYLKTIFRRSIAMPKEMDRHFAIEFNDYSTHCFGLRSLHPPFNAQLIFLTVSAAFILVSRFANARALDPAIIKQITDSWETKGKFAALVTVTNNVPFGQLYPSAGQIMLAVGWISCLCAVMMPLSLKFLPVLDKRIRVGGAVEFLREFIKYNDRKEKMLKSSVGCNSLASKFARNSFWPTGERRALLLFILAFFCLLLILFPVFPWKLHFVIQASYFAFLVILANGITFALFFALRWGLSIVSESLVKPEKGSEKDEDEEVEEK